MQIFSQTYVFALLSKSYNIKDILIRSISGEFDIKEGYDESFSPYAASINREINLPLKLNVMKAFDKKEIRFIFIPDTARFPAAIPIIMKRNGSEFTALVNIAPHCKIERSQDGIPHYKINYKKLYALLQAAYLYCKYMEDSKIFSNNVDLVANASNAFAQMIYYTLDKHYSVGSFYENIDKTLVIAAYYFASACVGYANAKGIASNIYMVSDKEYAADYVKMLPSQDKMVSLQSFINTLTTEISSLNNLSLDSFIGNFARDWNSASLVALEFFPYFLHIVGSAYLGAEITKDLLVIKLLRLEGQKLFKSLSTAL